MSVSLKKGGKLSLKKGMTNLSKLRVGLGWDSNRFSNDGEFDLDASAFLLAGNDKVTCDEDLIFYGNLVSKKGAVEHTGDNRTGEGDGDDETILVNLDKVPGNIDKIVFVVTIYEDGHNFGMIDNAYIRVINDEDNDEILRYDLTESYSIETGLVAGAICRNDDDTWEFQAIGEAVEGGLNTLCSRYGIEVED